MARVAGFNLTPVKSTALHQPEQIELRVEGAVGDRRFLFAREDGERLSGISKASLLPIRPRWDVAHERLALALDGEAVEEEAVGNGDPIVVRLYDREVAGRRVHELFDRFIRRVTGDDTLTLLRVAEPEYAGGTHRVSVVSRASVRQVGGHIGDPGLDARRFRMLIEVDGVAPHEEDAWRGRRVRIGEAIVRMGERMPRCVMTTLDPDTGAQNAPVLDALGKYRKVGNELLLGVYGDVEQAGTVTVGDPIELLPGSA
jgi:uncharacterized protein YcbX